MYWLAYKVDGFWGLEGPFKSFDEVKKVEQEYILMYSCSTRSIDTMYLYFDERKNTFVPVLSETRILIEHNQDGTRWTKDSNGNWYLERRVYDED